MQTFVVLLRGINMGSRRKLPMADLRTLCTKAGWKQPETYIQSGNLIVDADDSADKLRRSLEVTHRHEQCRCPLVHEIRAAGLPLH